MLMRHPSAGQVIADAEEVIRLAKTVGVGTGVLEKKLALLRYWTGFDDKPAGPQGHVVLEERMKIRDSHQDKVMACIKQTTSRIDKRAKLFEKKAQDARAGYDVIQKVVVMY